MVARQLVSWGYQVELVQDSFISIEVCASCHEGNEVSTPLRRESVIPLQPLASDSPVPGTNNSQISAVRAGRNGVSHLTEGDALDYSAIDAHDIRGDETTTDEGQMLCTQGVRSTFNSREQPLRPLGGRAIIDRYSLLYLIACCTIGGQFLCCVVLISQSAVQETDTCSPSLTQQLSTEDEQHAPNSVMCSQLFKCTSATVLGQVPSQCTAVPEVSISLCDATRTDCPGVITSHPIEASASNEVSENTLQVCTFACASVQQAVAAYQNALQHTNRPVGRLQRETSEKQCIHPESAGGEGACLYKSVRWILRCCAWSHLFWVTESLNSMLC